jgi:hypothetical protein
MIGGIYRVCRVVIDRYAKLLDVRFDALRNDDCECMFSKFDMLFSNFCRCNGGSAVTKLPFRICKKRIFNGSQNHPSLILEHIRAIQYEVRGETRAASTYLLNQCLLPVTDAT